MQAEFDTNAAWTVAAVQSLGAQYAVPAACRGSGTPAALSWLLDAICVRRSEPFLDVGAGLGGPAEFARRERGVRPVCLDPMKQACRGARDLFGLKAIQADACRIPFADSSFRCGWSLGTLCTTTSREAWVAEWRRVLDRGARLGVLVLSSTEGSFDIPAGNSFPSLRELDRLWAAADFYPVRQRWASSLPRPDADWTAAEERVARRVADVHATQDLYAVVRQQERAVGDLIASGRVRGLLVVVARA
jgi:SAM-dependent methyltransferase